MVLPPYYYKPLSDEGLIGWYEHLHLALADRPIQIYFYNFPQMTGIEIPIAVIEHLHRRWPDRFAGIKDSSGKLEYCRQSTHLLPDLAVFPSSEVALGEAAQYGYSGCISATVNQTSRASGALWAGRENPDDALVASIRESRETIAAQPLIPAVKHLVAKRTDIAEWKNVLPPFLPLNAAQSAALDHFEPIRLPFPDGAFTTVFRG